MSTVTQVNTTYVTPRTWSTGELATANLLNTHLRDELTAVKTPAHGYADIDEGANYTTSSTSFADIDATDLAITITTAGGKVLCGFSGFANGTSLSTSGDRIFFDVAVDGTRDRLDDGITGCGNQNGVNVSFAFIIDGLTAASHTFKLQWRITAGTGTLYAGAGTASNDTHPQFWVVEIT